MTWNMDDDSISHAWIFDIMIPKMQSPLWMASLTPNRRFIHQTWKVTSAYALPIKSNKATNSSEFREQFIKFILNKLGCAYTYRGLDPNRVTL